MASLPTQYELVQSQHACSHATQCDRLRVFFRRGWDAIARPLETVGQTAHRSQVRDLMIDEIPDLEPFLQRVNDERRCAGKKPKLRLPYGLH